MPQSLEGISRHITHQFGSFSSKTYSNRILNDVNVLLAFEDYRSVLLTYTNRARNLHGPAVIKLFESENELKYKNRLHDFIETLRLFSKI